jgi:SPP1 family predicted phage head-tail adaptor
MSSLTDRLRHRVTIEALTIIRDEIGGVMEVWTPVHQGVPADIVPLSGREFMAAQATQSLVTARITIRYQPGITPAMRLRHGADTYNIEAVLPDPSARRHLTLMCSTGPQTDPPEQVELNQNWTIFTSAVDRSVNGELP